MKKLLTLLFAAVLLGMLALPSLAADDTWRMTHGDDSQDALLVGKVLETGVGYIRFDVVRTVNGKPAKSPFRLKRTNAFTQEFAPGDGILASVRYDQGNRSAGSVAYDIAKVQLMQNKKIKMDVNAYDVGFIEWIVNTGEDRLSGNGESVYRHIPGSEESELLFDGETKRWLLDSLDPKYKAPEVKRESIEQVLRALVKGIPREQMLQIAGIGFVCGAVFGTGIALLTVLLLRRKSRKSLR
ncbi:MAG: hypothetical protein LBC83_06555 [Oscillospiraceae bacterium]|jgi:hypothetical protein|nr:hypothetical protein [Oscillospiraceae bacterium]